MTNATVQARTIWYAKAMPNHFHVPNSCFMAMATTTQGMYRSTNTMKAYALNGVNCPLRTPLSGVRSSVSSTDSSEDMLEMPKPETTLAADALTAPPKETTISFR